VPPQAVLPTSQVHTPVEQTLPPVHAVPQTPQFEALDWRSTQTPVQEVRPVPQVAASMPPPSAPPVPAAPSLVEPPAPPVPAVPVESAFVSFGESVGESVGVSVGASTGASTPLSVPAPPAAPPACPPPPVPAVSPPTPLAPPPPPLAPPEPARASTPSFPASCLTGVLLPPQPAATKSNMLKPKPRCFFMSISREERSEDWLRQCDPLAETNCGAIVRAVNCRCPQRRKNFPLEEIFGGDFSEILELAHWRWVVLATHPICRFARVSCYVVAESKRYGPHTLAIPAPPQVCGNVQTPQSNARPQPSPMRPQNLKVGPVHGMGLQLGSPPHTCAIPPPPQV